MPGQIDAEQADSIGDYSIATSTLQKFIEQGDIATKDKAWYLQEMVRKQ
jgi:hypothetical protein